MKNKVLLFVLIGLISFWSGITYAADENATNAGYRITVLQDKLSHISSLDIEDALENFTDMDKHWSRLYVGKLSILEIVGGMPDGTYKPDAPIQVDQFIKMTVRAMGFKPGQSTKYWAQSYIDTAIEQKILNKGEFKDYTKHITRQEAARIIAKAVLFIDAAPNSRMDALVRSKIKDYAKIADADRQSVLIVYELGLMSGISDGTFKPGNNLTRAEAATVMIRYLDIKERKPFTPAADEVCVITEPDGNVDTVYPPSRIEVIKAANALKQGVDKDKGFVETVYNDESGKLFFSFYESKDVFEANSIEGEQMSIQINVLDDDRLLETPYSIAIYNPQAVKDLHSATVHSLFQYLYGKDTDIAMAAFNRYLDYAIKGDSINRMEWVMFNNRKALYYKVKDDEVFSVTINSLD